MLLRGNCLETLKTLDADSVDSIVTDPPYELGFMGKSWDASGIAYNAELWAECLRVLKPGGHLLAFSGSRTYHRMVVAIEDSGFDIRDQIMWLYGSGFPKSLNLKGEWQGWGTALKPAHEPIVVARKPLIGTVANNVLTYGTGGLNIDGSRVGSDEQGRWPANIVITHSPDCEQECAEGCPARELDESARYFTQTTYTEPDYPQFLYCAKAGKKERNAGLGDLDERQTTGGGGLTAEVRDDGSLETASAGGKYGSIKAKQQNFHPTVKPLTLMRHLVKLVTPSNGTVLDPFLGSGTTAMAATLEGFQWIGCEMTEDYWPIIEARVEWARAQTKETLF